MEVVSINKELLSNEVLDNAKDHYDHVMIIGYNKENNIEAFTSSGLVRKDKVLYLLETVKHKLLSGQW